MKKYTIVIGLLVLFSACKKEEETTTTTTTKGTTDISVLKDKFNTSNTTITVTDDNIIIVSKGVPNHKSVYYNTSNSLYEDYSASGFNKNPNSITEQNMTLTIPRYPAKASTHATTPMGAMGIAVNSVSLFNQYAAPGDDLESEKATFDQWSGHPQNQGVYHYHTEPTYLTSTNGNEALVGILLDGFPVYGPYENGVQVTNSDLDDYHGHTSATADFPNGIYHYHITSEDPYINGSGYYGTSGTITN